jgi:hypothetical protein
MAIAIMMNAGSKTMIAAMAMAKSMTAPNPLCGGPMDAGSAAVRRRLSTSTSLKTTSL